MRDTAAMRFHAIALLLGLMGFAVKTLKCMACKSPLSNGEKTVCGYCRAKEGSIYASTVQTVSELEVQFSQVRPWPHRGHSTAVRCGATGSCAGIHRGAVTPIAMLHGRCGHSASDAKVVYTKRCCARAGTARSSTEERRCKRTCKRRKMRWRGSNGSSHRTLTIKEPKARRCNVRALMVASCR